VFATTKKQLQHLCVEQALYSLPINMSDEIRWPQSRLKSWTALVHGHNQMMHCIEVRVAIVYTNGMDSKAETTRTTTYDDRRL